MSINSFTFNNVSSATLGLYVGGQRTFNSPQRNVTKVVIPGRNGDLVKDNGRFDNVEVGYSVVAMADFRDTALAVRNWLLSVVGYARLEDTYHPDHYRMARLASAIEFETSAYNATAKAQVIFDCMPQKFLKTGDTQITLNASGTVTNPTQFASKPIIRVYGSGDCEITVGNQIISLSDVSGYIDIDSETMNCYNGVVNCNNKVTLGAHGFPTLPPGNTGIVLGTGTTSVVITPKWWEL